MNPNPRIASLSVDDEAITAHLADGRVVSVPLAWSWRLSEATSEQRANFEILGQGQGVRWPDVDEDIGHPQEMLKFEVVIAPQVSRGRDDHR